MDKAEHAQILAKEGLTQSEIGRRLGVSQPRVSVLLHPGRQTAYFRAYLQKPEVKERRRAYRQRPEVREQTRLRDRRYHQRPDVKERRRVYAQTYWQRPEVKQRNLHKGCCPSCGHVTFLMDFRMNHA